MKIANTQLKKQLRNTQSQNTFVVQFTTPSIDLSLNQIPVVVKIIDRLFAV